MKNATPLHRPHQRMNATDRNPPKTRRPGLGRADPTTTAVMDRNGFHGPSQTLQRLVPVAQRGLRLKPAWGPPRMPKTRFQSTILIVRSPQTENLPNIHQSNPSIEESKPVGSHRSLPSTDGTKWSETEQRTEESFPPVHGWNALLHARRRRRLGNTSWPNLT